VWLPDARASRDLQIGCPRFVVRVAMPGDREYPYQATSDRSTPMGYGPELPEIPDEEFALHEDDAELGRHVAELKALLAGGQLSPDTRARSLAALLEIGAAVRGKELADTLNEFAAEAHLLAEALPPQWGHPGP
jgi:hypothetical protein